MKKQLMLPALIEVEQHQGETRQLRFCWIVTGYKILI